MSIKARIWWDNASSAYLINIPYNDKFIEALKTFIPSGERNFDPSTKTWYVAEKYGDFIRKLAQDAFGISGVSFTSKDVAQQSQSYASSPGSAGKAAMINSSGGTTEDAIVAFFSLLHYDAARKAYREAAQALHPDKPSGDGQKMIKLNELWSRIEKEFFKR